MSLLWELLGRFSCDNEDGLRHTLGSLGGIQERDITAFCDNFRAKLPEYRFISRVELIELYRLMQSKIFAERSTGLGKALKTVIPDPSMGVKQVFGLSLIDPPFVEALRENPAAARENYHLPITADEAKKLKDYFDNLEVGIFVETEPSQNRRKVSKEDRDLVHLFWSPPDCYWAASRGTALPALERVSGPGFARGTPAGKGGPAGVSQAAGAAGAGS